MASWGIEGLLKTSLPYQPGRSPRARPNRYGHHSPLRAPSRAGHRIPGSPSGPPTGYDGSGERHHHADVTPRSDAIGHARHRSRQVSTSCTDSDSATALHIHRRVNEHNPSSDRWRGQLRLVTHPGRRILQRRRSVHAGPRPHARPVRPVSRSRPRVRHGLRRRCQEGRLRPRRRHRLLREQHDQVRRRAPPRA